MAVLLSVAGVTQAQTPVTLQLAFESPELTVAVGAQGTAQLRLLGDVPAGAAVTVELSATDGTTARVVTESVMFSAATTSREVTVAGEAAGSVTITAIADVSDSSLTVVPAELAVTVVPAPMMLQLAFEPPALEVVAGATAMTTLSLPGVPAGAEVEVILSVADKSAVRLVTAETVAFTADTSSHEVTVAGVAAGSSTLTAVADVSGATDLPPNSSVMSTELAVTVVPVPVILQLAFEPPALEVAAGATAMTTLSLPGVPAGFVVPVALSVVGRAVRLTSAEEIEFDHMMDVQRVTIEGVTVGSATLTAVADVSGFPPGSTVEPAELAVAVNLQLVFRQESELTIEVGETYTLLVGFLASGVPSGATVRVRVSASDETVARVSSDQLLVFGFGTRSRGVAVTGGAAGSATLTAVAVNVSGFPPGSTVEPAELAVTVVLPTVSLQLAFEPSPLTVAAGATATATLRLPGVPVGTEVTVALSVADEATARLVSLQSVAFDADTPSHEVTVEGVAVGNATMTAFALALDEFSAESTVVSAELPVTVVLPTVSLQLAFEPSSLTVATGAMTTVTLRLSGVPAGAEVTVALSVADEATARVVSLQSVAFDADTPSYEVTVEGVAEGSAVVMAIALEPDGLSAESTVEPAELPVTVVEEILGLRLRVRALLEGPLQ